MYGHYFVVQDKLICNLLASIFFFFLGLETKWQVSRKSHNRKISASNLDESVPVMVPNEEKPCHQGEANKMVREKDMLVDPIIGEN